jgi:hypothetical protein
MIYRRKTHTGKVIMLTLLAFVGFVAYDYFMPVRVSAVDEATNTVSPSGDALLATVDQIDSLHLDPSVFSNRVFLNLKDKTTTLSPQQVGKSNPFAPLGTVQTQSTSKTRR